MGQFATRELLVHEREQTMTIAKSRLLEVAQVGVIAGVAGGLAEVAWISIYGAVSGVSVDIVAEEITRSIVPHASFSSVWAGILIHLTLAVSLGVGGGLRDPPFAWVWPRLCRIQSRDPDACHSMGREFSSRPALS